MPTVQEHLADEGVTFANAFAVNPLCCPSRASILTGQYSHTTGVYTNAPPHGGFAAFDDSSTLATRLQSEGYHTALIGKYLNYYTRAEASYIPPGWTRWFAFTGGFKDGFGYSVSVDGINTEFTGEEQYGTDVLAAEAAAFIQETPSDIPLFLYFSPSAPHKPATPAPRHAATFSGLAPWRPPSYNEDDASDKPSHIRTLLPLTFDQQAEIDDLRVNMYRSLLAVDEAVGTIVEALEGTGRLSNTLLVFASDNGYAWGEHRWDSKGVPYEESIRIPLVVRFDPLVVSPRTDTHLVLNIDLAPTFAAAAGQPAQGLDGRSLLPLLSSDAVPGRHNFLIESLLEPGPSARVPTYCAVRTLRYLYVDYLEAEEEELYDLTLDPNQLTNVVRNEQYSGTLWTLRGRLASLCAPRPPSP